MDGKTLRAKREALHLTQAQLAQELGVTANTVARWERGEMAIKSPRLVEMALEHLREVFRMAAKLDWTHEDAPGWDSTGTIAESWTAEHDKYVARIDHFADDDGGGHAYTVTYDGDAVRHGENMPAVSWDQAEHRCMALLGMITEPVQAIMDGWNREAGLPVEATDPLDLSPASPWTLETWLIALEEGDAGAILEGRRMWGLPALV